MSARGTMISVRLNRDELNALRRAPGENDSARVRTLIHAQALHELVVLDGNKTRGLITKLSTQIKNVMEDLYDANQT